MRSLRIVIAVGTLAFAGCKCRSDGPNQVSNGEVGIVYDQGGTSITGHDATLDFGKVGMGQTRPMTITIKNLGTGPLDLVGVEKDSGENVKAGAIDMMP